MLYFEEKIKLYEYCMKMYIDVSPKTCLNLFYLCSLNSGLIKKKKRVPEMYYFAPVILIRINIWKIILHNNTHTSIQPIQSLLKFVSYVSCQGNVLSRYRI